MWSNSDVDDSSAASGDAESDLADPLEEHPSDPFEGHGKKRDVTIMDDDQPAHATGHPGRRGSLLQLVASEMMDQTEPGEHRATRRTKFFGFEDSMGESTSSPTLGRNHSTVRDNMKRRRTMRQEHLQQLIEKANKRHEIAQSRRHFLETKRDAQAAAMWLAVLAAFTFAYRIDNRREIHFALTLFARRLGPITRLKQHRMRRKRVVEEFTNGGYPKPTPDDLMKDPILRHFGAVHIRSVIPTMKPTAIMEGDTMVYQGEAGQQCFFVSAGKVAVYVRSGSRGEETCVATLGPHAVLGSIGMVSGEKRMARLVAIENTWCYVINRHDFLRSAADEKMMKLALEEVHRQHRENVPKIYAPSVKGDALARFPLFAGVDASLLDQMRARNLLKAFVFNPGELIVSAGSSSNRMYFVLNGTVNAHREEKSSNTPSAELLAFMADVSNTESKGDRKAYFVASSDGASKRGFVGTLSDRSVIGGPAFLLMEPYHLTLQAHTAVDTLAIDSREFVQLMLADPTAFKRMRTNACRSMAQWLKPLTKHSALHAIFPSVASTAVNALRAHRRAWFDMTPRVFLRGETLDFNAECRMGYIIINGSLEGSVSAKGSPVLWPSTPTFFFAHQNTYARAATRIDAWCLSRRDFFMVLRAVLSDERMSSVYVEMAKRADVRPGKIPAFEEVPGVSIANPFLGAQPPAPPPDRAGRRRRARRASTTSHESAASHPDNEKDSNGNDGEDSEPDSEGEAQPRRRSSVVIINADESDPSASNSRASSPTDSGLTAGRTAISILPANFRRAQPPMESVIKRVQREQGRSPPPRRRSPSPQGKTNRLVDSTLPEQSASSARPLRPRPPPTLSDPYRRLFGETEVADILRDMEPGHAGERPHGAAVDVASMTHPHATRHSVKLADVRTTRGAHRRRQM